MDGSYLARLTDSCCLLIALLSLLLFRWNNFNLQDHLDRLRWYCMGYSYIALHFRFKELLEDKNINQLHVENRRPRSFRALNSVLGQHRPSHRRALRQSRRTFQNLIASQIYSKLERMPVGKLDETSCTPPWTTFLRVRWSAVSQGLEWVAGGQGGRPPAHQTRQLHFNVGDMSVQGRNLVSIYLAVLM